MRLQVAQLLRKSIEELKKAAFVVEHDIIKIIIYFIKVHITH